MAATVKKQVQHRDVREEIHATPPKTHSPIGPAPYNEYGSASRNAPTPMVRRGDGITATADETVSPQTNVDKYLYCVIVTPDAPTRTGEDITGPGDLHPRRSIRVVMRKYSRLRW
jgi:hypothetical protein